MPWCLTAAKGAFEFVQQGERMIIVDLLGNILETGEKCRLFNQHLDFFEFCFVFGVRCNIRQVFLVGAGARHSPRRHV